MFQYRSSQEFIKSGGAPKYGVEDIIDAHAVSEVMLNFHADGDSGGTVLEVARLVPHLSNGIVIVSERGNDAKQQGMFAEVLTFVPEGQQTVRDGRYAVL